MIDVKREGGNLVITIRCEISKALLDKAWEQGEPKEAEPVPTPTEEKPETASGKRRGRPKKAEPAPQEAQAATDDLFSVIDVDVTPAKDEPPAKEEPTKPASSAQTQETLARQALDIITRMVSRDPSAAIQIRKLREEVAGYHVAVRDMNTEQLSRFLERLKLLAFQ